MHHERERKGRKTQAGKQHHYVKTTEIRCERNTAVRVLYSAKHYHLQKEQEAATATAAAQNNPRRPVEYKA